MPRRRTPAHADGDDAAIAPDATFVDALPTAAFVVDAEGRPLRWNAAAVALWGRAPGGDDDLFTGPHRLARVDGAPLATDEAPAARALRTRAEVHGAVVAIRGDGSRSVLDVDAGPLRDGDEVVGAIVVLRPRAASDAEARLDADRRAPSVEERFRLLVSAVREYAIFMLDADGRVASWNEGAQRIKGYREDEILGQPYERFFPAEDVVAGAPARLLASARDTGSVTFEAWRVRKDGARFWASVVLTAVRDEEGALRGYVKVTRDETERHRVLGELRAALERARAAEEALRAHADLLELRVEERTRQVTEHADRLQRSNAELERFAYVASHDLKEPLRMVSQYVGLLRLRLGSAARDDLDRYAAHAVMGATRMLGLIEALLEYSRVEHDGLELAEVDVARIVDELRDQLDVAFAESGATLATGALPTLRADRARLAQVLQNLIANAVKYRADGRAPLVRLTAERADDAWVFAVADNGIGIAPEHRDAVFQPFRRLHTYAQVSGAGVGLAICRRLVELHGGRIWVESTPGVGSTFRFTIPDRAPMR